MRFDFGRMARHVAGEDLALRRAFPPELLKRIEAEIVSQERQHGGEMRFAVEGGLSPGAVLRGVTARERAQELFASLRVWDTADNNGVLVYLLLADRAVEIVADRGLQGVGAEAWAAICAQMQEHFAAGRYEEGLVHGLRRITGLLARHFPAAGDRGNELPDAPVVL